MTTRSGPIHEVTFFADRDVVDEFDRWLEEHARNSLQIAAVSDCRCFPIADDQHGCAGRICQHLLEDEQALDEYLENRFESIDSDVTSSFGEKVEVSDRVLREDQSRDSHSDESPDCRNCGTRLQGQYCGNCGQRSRGRLISLWELISDAFGDLLEIDSRLWQTLVQLMLKPGQLTHDYLQGRRARYMPPFRMYLVMSLLFFVVAFFDPREELGIFFEPPAESESVAEEDAIGGGLIVDFDDDEDADDEDDEEQDCDVGLDDIEEMPGFLSRRFTVERLTRVCEAITADDGRALVSKVIENIPAALIILLPFMALVLKALYPLSRRYYVEHLLFFVHFHAFFFLMLTLQILFARFTAMLSFPENATAFIVFATSFYIPFYFFVAMRTVYGQGRLVTSLKYIVLTISYVAGFFVTMLATLGIAAFAI
jgi:hypothetical protein